MTRNEQFLRILAAVLTAAAPELANAGTVTRTTTTAYVAGGSNSSVTIDFADVVDADQLVSISAGSLSTAEGGSFSVVADYDGMPAATIYSGNLGFFDGYQLRNLPPLSFATGTVAGITINGYNSGGFPIGINIPTGTTFTFNTVASQPSPTPEPATWTTLIVGFGIVGHALRRRRSRQRGQRAATGELRRG